MADVWSLGSQMGANNEDDSADRCRERRRRRIEMRRLAVASAAAGTSQSSSSTSHSPQTNTTRDHYSSTSSEDAANNVPQVADFLSPVVGVMSVAGRLREMEDAITVKTSICRPEINRHRPVHFFGVFDGHGGPHVAALCREWMHVIFVEEVMRVGNITAPSASNSNSPPQPNQKTRVKEIQEAWRRVLRACFVRMDELATRDSCGCEEEGKCGCQLSEVALSGSTAVVVILTQEDIIVANCGDSRALLCRGGWSIPLSIDHKPDRDDERARIEASGGRVIFNNGARVEGILAMSRSIGDKYLKPLVTAEPEIFFRGRKEEDECLILASDGLWDVLSNAMAAQVARECLKEDKRTAEENSTRRWTETEWNDPLFPTRSASAAGLLTRLAFGRKSYDNISVIVVDLKRNQMGG